LELLGRLCGDQWSDFNSHDPGITILEQLCYAITDLAYRSNFPIADLIATGGMEAWPPPAAGGGAENSVVRTQRLPPQRH
jgi:hypothetical protein